MSDLDIRLTEALNTDPPPAQDARFRVEVLLRIERARFKRRVIRTLAVALAATALFAVNAQAIEAWIVMDMWCLWIIAVGALVGMFFLASRSRRSLASEVLRASLAGGCTRSVRNCRCIGKKV